MKTIKNKTYDHERSLYALKDAIVDNCKFEGKTDGESPIKESKNVKVSNCLFNLRYPFWHDDGINITSTTLTNLSRTALWYSKNVKINQTFYALKH